MISWYSRDKSSTTGPVDVGLQISFPVTDSLTYKAGQEDIQGGNSHCSHLHSQTIDTEVL